jgi:cysteine desulfurase
LSAIYLDHATTTRPDPRILAAMLPYLGEEFGDPRSPHSLGRAARAALEKAREEVARLVGCATDEVVFTSSATEANHLALRGVFRARGRRSSRLVVSAIEHVSVLHAALTLREEGAQVDLLRVEAHGRADLDHLSRLLESPPALVSVMHANGEIGTMQPLAEIRRLTRAAGALLHTDATLGAALFPGLWQEFEPDLLSLTPHLFHGPKGIGALVVREGVRLKPQMEGGTQEGGRRAGTPSVALAVGFGEAARLARAEAPDRVRRRAGLAARLRSLLEQELGEWIPTGDREHRLPGHLSLCLRYVEGEAVLGLLDDAGIAAGSGSACTRGAGKPSHVLAAVGIDPVLARGALDFCFGAFSADSEPEQVTSELTGIVSRLRALSPLTPARS